MPTPSAACALKRFEDMTGNQAGAMTSSVSLRPLDRRISSRDLAPALSLALVLALAGVSGRLAPALSFAGVLSGAIVFVHRAAGFHSGLVRGTSRRRQHHSTDQPSQSSGRDDRSFFSVHSMSGSAVTNAVITSERMLIPSGVRKLGVTSLGIYSGNSIERQIPTTIRQSSSPRSQLFHRSHAG